MAIIINILAQNGSVIHSIGTEIKCILISNLFTKPSDANMLFIITEYPTKDATQGKKIAVLKSH